MFTEDYQVRTGSKSTALTVNSFVLVTSYAWIPRRQESVWSLLVNLWKSTSLFCNWESLVIASRLSIWTNTHALPYWRQNLNWFVFFLVFVFARQVETIQQYFPVFDKLRKEFFVGELIWNFADFMTKQRKIEFYLSMSVQCIYRVLTL